MRARRSANLHRQLLDELGELGIGDTGPPVTEIGAVQQNRGHQDFA
jgi:hypothetical protein